MQLRFEAARRPWATLPFTGDFGRQRRYAIRPIKSMATVTPRQGVGSFEGFDLSALVAKGFFFFFPPPPLRLTQWLGE